METQLIVAFYDRSGIGQIIDSISFGVIVDIQESGNDRDGQTDDE